MCGRFANIEKWEKIRAYYDAHNNNDEWEGSYNVAPTQKAPVIIETEQGREIRLMKWGLVPHWSLDTKKAATMINARGETVAEKPAFRDSFKRKRCIVPVTGFYEWKTVGKEKYPTFFTPNEGIFSFSGLWSEWRSPEGEKLETFSIITTTANEVVGKIHNRMPVAITNNMMGAWLAAETSSDELKSFLAPYPASQMKGVEVSQYMNSYKNHGEECIAPINSL